MKRIEIDNFLHYLQKIDEIVNKYDDKYIILYRGQSKDTTIYPLLPSIARKKNKTDTTQLEKTTLIELTRRSKVLRPNNLKTLWDWLVYAQHFGLKTRLLDWTTNPLVALWFSCVNNLQEENAYVYLFFASQTSIIVDKKKSPFEITSTKVLFPPQNNERLVAQSGVFTVHPYSKSAKHFVRLEYNRNYKNRIFELVIPGEEKSDILRKLNTFGINYRSLFPDFEGLCKQLNWEKRL